MRNGFVDNESDAFNAPAWRSVAVLGMSDLGYKGICSAAFSRARIRTPYSLNRCTVSFRSSCE